MSERKNGVILVARKGGEYWFIDSVFQYDNNAGCTGMMCYPITEEMMDDLLSIDNLVERFGDYWEEKYQNDVDENCEACDGWINEDGCKDCGYPSVESSCNEIAQYWGSDAVIDDPGGEYAEALDAVCEDKIEYADLIGCGRIFHGHDKQMSPDDFDEVYNLKALVAALAYEDSAVDYNYAIKAISGGCVNGHKVMEGKPKRESKRESKRETYPKRVKHERTVERRAGVWGILSSF